MALAARELVRRLVSQHRVVIFSKTYCPYCMDAKTVLKSAAQTSTSGDNSMLVLELDRRDDEREIQSALTEITGKGIVPSVWVGGKFIGGSTETRDLYEVGKLQQLVQSVIS